MKLLRQQLTIWQVKWLLSSCRLRSWRFSPTSHGSATPHLVLCFGKPGVQGHVPAVCTVPSDCSKSKHYLEHIHNMKIMKKNRKCLEFHHFLLIPGWKSSQVDGGFYECFLLASIGHLLSFNCHSQRKPAICQRLKVLSVRWFSLELSHEVGLNSIWLKNVQIWRSSELHPLFGSFRLVDLMGST